MSCLCLQYFVLVTIIFILELSLGIIAFVYRDDLSDDLRKEVTKSLDKYDSDDGVKDGWDIIQQEVSTALVFVVSWANTFRVI